MKNKMKKKGASKIECVIATALIVLLGIAIFQNKDLVPTRGERGYEIMDVTKASFLEHLAMAIPSFTLQRVNNDEFGAAGASYIIRVPGTNWTVASEFYVRSDALDIDWIINELGFRPSGYDGDGYEIWENVRYRKEAVMDNAPDFPVRIRKYTVQ